MAPPLNDTPRFSLHRTIYCLLIIIFLFFSTGCSDNDEKKRGHNATEKVAVDVMVLQPRTIALSEVLSGYIKASVIAEIKAKTAGRVIKKNYQEGALVTKGEVLYQLDNEKEQIEVTQKNAALQKIKVEVAINLRELNRAKSLFEKKNLSQEEYDKKESNLKKSQAEQAAAEASLKLAQISLSETTITAPITGYAGASAVSEGAEVSPSMSLTTIQQIDPLFVDVKQASNAFLPWYQRCYHNRASDTLSKQCQRTVQLMLDNNQFYPYLGTIDFTDMSVDKKSDSIAIRITFPNKEKQLLPGLFVRVQWIYTHLEETILIPHRSLHTKNDGSYQVHIVDAEDKIEERPVKLAGNYGNYWVVAAGLQPGERLVVMGKQHVQSSTLVEVTTIANAAEDHFVLFPHAYYPLTQ